MILVFCKRYSKPFMLPESGAAFYLDYTHRTSTGAMETYEAPPGPGELKLKETWWNQAWNKENAKRWPLLKAIVNFEESKLDERGNTTYELTFDPRIRATFLRDIEASGVDPIWLEDVKGYGCDGRIGLKN